MISNIPILVNTALLKYFKNIVLQYCHYVAGLVGIGLSRLFSASELEDPLVGEDIECANSMGLFLQKTNIIRDYLEDQREGREFWPQEVTDLGDLGKIILNTFLKTKQNFWLEVMEMSVQIAYPNKRKRN